MDIETRIRVLNSILDKPKQQQAVEQELLAAKGDLSVASAALKGKLLHKALQKLQVADLVASAVGDQPEVAKAILSKPGIKTPRDVAKLNVDQLIELIAPVAKPGTKAYQQAKSQAIAINNQSFAREPLTVLQRMTHEDELPITDAKVRTRLGTFLNNIPADTDIRIAPIHEVMKGSKGKDKFGQTLRKKKIAHLSFSQVAAVEFCQQRYFLNYIQAVQLDPEPNYFIKGKLLHQFIASSYLKIANARKIDPSSYSKIINRYYEDPHRRHLENAVQVHLENLWQGYQIIGVEEPFVIVVDKKLPPLVGVIDLLMKKDNCLIIVDHKTGNNFYPPDELQMAIYYRFIKQMFPKKKIKIYYDHYRWVNNLNRIRKPALMRTEVVLPSSYWKDALVRIRDGYRIMETIKEEKWAKRQGECFRCPFRQVCWSD
jgi:ATP-dependent exoDNAse (exonuclease V) beta subunit